MSAGPKCAALIRQYTTRSQSTDRNVLAPRASRLPWADQEVAASSEPTINTGTQYPLTMRLSDVRCRKPKLIYLNHSTLPDLNEAETRCSNRLLEACATAFSTAVPAPQNRNLDSRLDAPKPFPPESINPCDEFLPKRPWEGDQPALESEATYRPQIIAAPDSR